MSDTNWWWNPKVVSMAMVCEPQVLVDLEFDISYPISPYIYEDPLIDCKLSEGLQAIV